MHLFEHRAALSEILELLGLAQRCFVRRLDPDEHGHEIGLDHEPHKLGIVGEIQRRLRNKAQGIPMVPLPAHDLSEQFLHRPLVADRSEEHTSELQSRRDLVCRLLLEKKKKKKLTNHTEKKKQTTKNK